MITTGFILNTTEKMEPGQVRLGGCGAPQLKRKGKMGKMVEYNMAAFDHAPTVRLDQDSSSVLWEFEFFVTCMSSLGLSVVPTIENCP